MTLEATTGGVSSIMPDQRLTLLAGGGLIILNDMTTQTSNKPLVMDTDFESEGDGTLTVWTGKTVTSNKSDVTITAWDVDMGGSLTAGTRTLCIHGSKVEQTIGLGGTAKDLHITGPELQRITATGGVILGGDTGGSITVNGITQAHSDYLLPLVTLVAKHDDAQVAFDTVGSTFYAIEVQADNGIIVERALNTDTGSLYLDGDKENNSGGDATNTI